MNKFSKVSCFVGFLLFIAISAQARLNAGDLLEESFPQFQLDTSVDWSQPAIGCPEEMIPALPSRPCLDLSGVSDAMNDWPTNLTPEDQSFWTSHRRFMAYCRGEEIVRREAATPGSQKSAQLELAWFLEQSVNHHDENVASIVEANTLYGIPQSVLVGAIYQESLFAGLSVGEDGGNYSCGVGQYNLRAWCKWANAQSSVEKTRLGWPQNSVDCNNDNLVSPRIVKPLYDLAVAKLGTLPVYKMDKSYFADITVSDVSANWSDVSPAIQQKRFQLARSFTDHCSEPHSGILVSAHELSEIYREFISPALQKKDRYTAGDHFQRACANPDHGNSYPLHTGWLLSVAAYNAGPRAVNAVTYYNQWNRSEFNTPSVIKDLDPSALIASLYWSGKYSTTDDSFHFQNPQGAWESWTWQTACVVQRHIAKVIQNNTLLPVFFVNSLEAPYSCSKSVFENGHMVQSAVPPERQISSGIKTSR